MTADSSAAEGPENSPPAGGAAGKSERPPRSPREEDILERFSLSDQAAEKIEPDDQGADGSESDGNLPEDSGHGHVESGSGTYSLAGGPHEPPVLQPVAAVPPGTTGVTPPAQPVPRRAARTVKAAAARVPANQQRNTFWFLLGCNLIVFASSLCIMVLELTASRLIARHVGSSLYTWTSVIGVVLAGITIGNWLGGWLADRFDPSRLLGLLFLVASMLSFSILLTDSLAAGVPRPDGWGWSAWILAVVVCLFLLPSISLGTISPVVACLALSRSSRTGMTVGNVYAWGAMGSIAGTFLTGFYLIDVAGSKAIIVMTAAALAIIGLVVAGGRRAFQASVLLGWMQLLLVFGLLTTASVTWLPEGEVTGGIHQLGLSLGLRNDEPGSWYDESDYSWIHVGDTTSDGDEVRYLKLDKLIHSYFNPRNPAALYYDYEHIYAAVTERAADGWDRGTTVSLAEPGAENAAGGADAAKTTSTPLVTLAASLPAGTTFDQSARSLASRGALTRQERQELLSRSPSGPLWAALETLHWMTTRPGWGGFTSVPVEDVPEGYTVPEELNRIVQHDRRLQQITAYAMIDRRVFESLISATPDSTWYQAVDQLFRQSRRTSTLFIGGGGFIFPRWIEQEFPADPEIVVAELDPAVLTAVIAELDLDPEGRIARGTRIGDARNVVMELALENERATDSGRTPPHRFDFVYGDAFNDFSVPWHLTTREFTEQVNSLMSDEGVFLVNIIDIYPRTIFPNERRGRGEAFFTGPVPPGLLNGPPPAGTWVPARSEFGPLQFKQIATDSYRLRYEGTMSDQTLDALASLDLEQAEFGSAIDQLYAQSTDWKPTPFAIPRELIPDTMVRQDEWTPCPAPWNGLEIMAVEELPAVEPVAAPVPGQPAEQTAEAAAGTSLPPTHDRYVLAVRGRMTDELLDSLGKLASADTAWLAAIRQLHAKSQLKTPGRFLASYVNTVRQVFPAVSVFSSEQGGYPDGQRDTFVIACSRRPLDLSSLEYYETSTSGQRIRKWYGQPFASLVSAEADSPVEQTGLMTPLLAHARQLTLTDDFAPVDNLLIPVFTDQD